MIRIRKRAKRARLVGRIKRDPSRGSPRSFAAQRTLAQDDKLTVVRVQGIGYAGGNRKACNWALSFLFLFAWSSIMTLVSFVRKNAFRNKRHSILTLLSIGFSLLLLTVMMTIWRAFYLSDGSAESAQRLIVRHKVSLAQFLPISDRERIRPLPGVKQVV